MPATATMKLELKNIGIYPRMSRETNCFKATIYLNGKKVGTVENDGGGACHRYSWIDHKVGKEIIEWSLTQPTKYDFEKLDQIVDDLLAKFETLRELKKWTKNETVYRLKDTKKGTWMTIRAKYSPQVKAALVAKHGDNLEIIANENLEAAAGL